MGCGSARKAETEAGACISGSCLTSDRRYFWSFSSGFGDITKIIHEMREERGQKNKNGQKTAHEHFALYLLEDSCG